MKKLEEIEFFERLLELPANQLVEEAIAEGRVPLGYNCCTVPRPLLSVGNAFPVRLRAPGIQSTELADFYMSSVLCSCSRSVLEMALNGGYDFVGGLVWANSCQHSTRCGQHFIIKEVNADKDGFFTYMLETPRKTGEPSIELFRKYLKKAARLIADRYQIDMSDDAIRQAIYRQNNFNSLLQQISDMRKSDRPKITGSEFARLMIACQVAPDYLLMEPISRLQASLEKREGHGAYRARLMVVGPMMDDPRYIQVIEDQGALVVADRYCYGSQPGLELISAKGDPYYNLASHYLHSCECPRMIDMSQIRIDKLIERVKEFKVDGIVMETIKFCDMWGYEILTMEKGLRQAGIPLVRIEREYSFTGEGQFRTRIQAFIESIESKRN